MKKKYGITFGLLGALVVGTLTARYINAGNIPVTISKDQIVEETKVTDEEKEILEKNGISFDDILADAEKDVSFLFDSDVTKMDRNDRFIFYNDGAMEGGPVDGVGSYIADGRTGIVLARFNPGTDPESVDFKTARKLRYLQTVRNTVDYKLKECK